MNEINIREAAPEDIDFLQRLESTCFPAHRQSSRRSIKNSLTSPNQLVYVVEQGQNKEKMVKSGAATVFLHRRSLRIYSIAVNPDFRRSGVGELLIQHITDLSVAKGFEKITLEADASNMRLVDWYRKFLFETTHQLIDYYGPGENAFRMEKKLTDSPIRSLKGGNIIVVDNDKKQHIQLPMVNVISAREYLSDETFRNSDRFHVLNLCCSYRTHSIGYYVSLLAAARNHRTTPSVMSVKDISNLSIAQSLFDEIREFAEDKLRHLSKETFELTVILGKTEHNRYVDFGRKLFALFNIPFFTISLVKSEGWRVRKLKILTLDHISKNHPEILNESLSLYFEKKRYRRTHLKKYKYDLAILVNHEEKTPPSCRKALDRFKKAAEKVGFFVEFITKMDYRRICEFDALFIRETTAIENHTYNIARHAYTEGLVVIDDPWSILHCSNKVYLHERLSKAGISQPRTWLLTKKKCDETIIDSLPFPLVLKLPESSFSLDVFRVDSREEMESKLAEMFSKSDLVIAQEFLESEYDWRIGVLDNTPLFACKYYMARGHWQIYNWESKGESDFSGNSETIPINQVPTAIINAAVRSSSLIGNGLYGVDIKEIEGKAYVIEINDNPNIDAGIEDLLLQDELYLRIMTSLFNRIEKERQCTRYPI